MLLIVDFCFFPRCEFWLPESRNIPHRVNRKISFTLADFQNLDTPSNLQLMKVVQCDRRPHS